MQEFQETDVFDFEHYDEPDQNTNPDDENVDLFNTPDDQNNDQDQFTDDQDQNQDDQNQEITDAIAQYLKGKGIDKTAIRIQNEQGEIETVNYDDLSPEEQLSVLALKDESPISDAEVETLNYLRANKMSLQDFANWQRAEAIKEYEQNKTKSYKVDTISDDDLYKFDLTERYGDMTEDELTEELTAAKTNEALFNKKIAALRKEYKELEDNQAQAEEAATKAQAEQEWQEMSNEVIRSARNTKDLHNLMLEDEDKEAILSFILDKDANEQTEFYKALQNPDNLFKMAWYLKFGDQAFQAVNDYYKGVIEKSRRSEPKAPSKVVKKPQRSTQPDVFDLGEQIKNLK